ncbi:hypothetical protein [Streptomyces sp. NBC_01264]|uniref:hypothetical protein n=1 Tax=Streptomyces sp. NBC_01264 TaxID=2903804 RepID=UPI002251CE83|nr:hypothetical protein [Streptomyces sp. NBC_01264]MCX4778176.1 hypothetical protein [Streptomyces sp. NBC_01264]
MGNDIEINVRVSNQTAGGLAGVNASMAQLKSRAREASTAVTALRASLAGVASLDVDLHDNTASGVAAIESAISALRAESPVRIEAEFTGDAAEIASTAQAVRNLRTNAGSASTALTNLSARASAAAAALTVLKSAAQEASNALRTLRGRAAATATAMQDLRNHSFAAGNSLRTMSTRANSANGRMETLGTRTVALATSMDGLNGSLRRVGGSMTGLRGGMGSLSSASGSAADGSRNLMMAAIALAPALVPVAAAVAPLVPAFAAVGVAAAAFGAVLIPQIMSLGDLSKAHEKYKEAVEDSGRASVQAGEAEKAWLKEVSKASPEVRKASAALDLMKDAYKDWTKSLAGDTLPVATKGFGILSALFPKLTPLVKAAASEFDRLMNLLAVGVQSKGFDELIAKTADFSQRSLRAAIDGMVAFGQAVSRGIQSDGFRQFLAYARESGPAVVETLGNLVRALGKVVVAAADTGVGVLTIVNALAKLVNAVPTELLSVLLQMAFAMKALQLVSTGLGPALAAAATGASGFIRAARFGGVSAAIAGVTASLTALQRASIVLAVLTAVVIGINELAEKAKGAPPDVDRLTTSLKSLGAAGNFTGELKKTFGDMDGFVAKVQEMHAKTSAFDELKKFTSLVPMGPLIDKATEKISELAYGAKSLGALKDDFKAFDDAFASLAKGGHADEAAAQFSRFEEALRATGMTTEQITEMFSQYQAAVAALAADQEIAARSMGLFGEQAVAVQSKLDLQKQSADGLRQSIQALNDVNRSALDGMIGFEAAIDAAAKAAADNKGQLHMVNGVLDLNSEKARAAASSLSALADKTDEAAGAARENGESWAAVSGIYERGRQQLIANAEQMGLNKDQAAALAAQILATPDKTAYLTGDISDLQAKLKDARARLAAAPSAKQVAIRAEIADLLEKMRRANAAVNAVHDKTVYIRTIYQNFTSNHPGGQAQAHGGIIGAAGGGPRSRMTLVGEQGPELVDLAPGSRVRSNPDSKRIAAGMAGGGGGGGPIVVQVMLDGRQVAEALIDPLQYEIGLRGGNVQSVIGRGTA